MIYICILTNTAHTCVKWYLTCTIPVLKYSMFIPIMNNSGEVQIVYKTWQPQNKLNFTYLFGCLNLCFFPRKQNSLSNVEVKLHINQISRFSKVFIWAVFVRLIEIQHTHVNVWFVVQRKTYVNKWKVLTTAFDGYS